MTRCTSRTTPIGIVAALLCLLLTAAQTHAQSEAQPANQPAEDSAPQPSQTSSSGQDSQLHTASRTELDVVKVVLAQQHAWNAGDVEGYIRQFKDSPDTLLIGREIIKGYPQILEDYQRNYTTRVSMGTLAYSELEVTTLSDDFAICTGRYHVDRSKKDGGSADGLFSLVLEKTPQGWKIVLDHTT